MGSGAPELGVTVTLREIYDVAKRAAEAAAGGRGDVAALRRDMQHLTARVDAVERQLKDTGTPAYLKKLGYALGVVAAAAAAGWGALHGGG